MVVAMLTVDVVAGGIVHGGVAVAVAMVAFGALVYTADKDTLGKIGIILEAILLIEHDFVKDIGDYTSRCGGDAALIAVGQIVARGP